MSSSDSSSKPSAGPLSPAAEQLLQGLRAQGFAGWSAMGLEGARRALLDIGVLAGPPEPIARVEQLQIPASDGHEIPATLYAPQSAQPPRTVLYLHGGGWCLGSYTLVDSIARRLANESGYEVVSADYRLAPEHKFRQRSTMLTMRWFGCPNTQSGWDWRRGLVGSPGTARGLTSRQLSRFGVVSKARRRWRSRCSFT